MDGPPYRCAHWQRFNAQYLVANLLGNIDDAVDELLSKAVSGLDYTLAPRNPNTPISPKELREGVHFAIQFGAINPSGLDRYTVEDALTLILERRLGGEVDVHAA